MIILSFLFFIAILLFDQASKWWAISHCTSPLAFSSWLSCSLSYNRGFSWSIFHAEDSLIFCFVSLIILIVTAFFAYYTYILYREGVSTLGPALVLAGAISNLIDRVVHGGVVDFIIIHYGDWYWPVFNVADAAICVGVGILLISQHNTPRGHA